MAGFVISEVKPTKDRVLCKILEGQRLRPSGIILPQFKYDFKTKSDVGTRAEVLACGPCQWQVVPGQEVIVDKFGGIEFSLGGHEYVIFDSHEVLAIVEGEETKWLGVAING